MRKELLERCNEYKAVDYWKQMRSIILHPYYDKWCSWYWLWWSVQLKHFGHDTNVYYDDSLSIPVISEQEVMNSKHHTELQKQYEWRKHTHAYLKNNEKQNKTKSKQKRMISEATTNEVDHMNCDNATIDVVIVMRLSMHYKIGENLCTIEDIDRIEVNRCTYYCPFIVHLVDRKLWQFALPLLFMTFEYKHVACFDTTLIDMHCSMVHTRAFLRNQLIHRHMRNYLRNGKLTLVGTTTSE